jgi:PadR family transcriptional regulator PadR
VAFTISSFEALRAASLLFFDRPLDVPKLQSFDNRYSAELISIAIYRRKASIVAAHKNDTLQGTLALLVLKTLLQGPMHGWGVTLHIQEVSDQVLRVEEGSLYPALHRMEQAGWIAAEWGVSENNRRARYYRLTAAGRKQLAAEETNWKQLTDAVARVLTYAAGPA